VNVIDAQLNAAAVLRDRMGKMIFAPPVARVYNPLSYAWGAFEEYVTRYGATEKRVLFLGMNPGPWGMTQTGVPFGEIAAVRGWLGISAPIGRPGAEHPKYPVDGYGCRRSEVSGRRLWGLFEERFGTAESFFEEHFVVNYCPLLFIEAWARQGREGARNLTPDKLPPSERAALYDACDAHLRQLVKIFSPRYVIGVGNFAATRAQEALKEVLKALLTIGKILHPSPASPKSNSDWSGEATRQLTELGVWKD
jgi:single-strand selective monofunctional uracil DNA glycosylase